MSREQTVAALKLAFAEIVDEGVVEQEWALEIVRRARRVTAGESTGERWEEVRDRIEQRLKKRD
ncbi:MAG TPA: hypothetical protein VGQ21_16245 [Thermoanaerobaculia bacterium]|nr:hypothetical protein [Thermoanaerobaculia bacterium]